MKRTKLRDRILPKYTKGEEIFNMTSHIVGGVLGIVALVLCVVFAAVHGNGYGVVSGAIYGVTMVILYTMSSIYHGLNPKRKAKKVFQVLDHCSIYLLIAGSYTPFALCTLREYSTALGWTIFGVIWFVAILGIILNSIDIKKFRVFSMICYLVMGWCIVFKINLLPELLGTAGFVLLLLGGLAYTIGAILYGLGKKHKYMHSVFHLFILLGSLLQFFTILLYVM
ncbi:channel protein hemolysin III family [Clostridium sp. CAG:354]|jgi:hemolysin III|nr:hemolysin III family protein [Clostridium sp.]MBS5863198.1 hemolysin III family protein [Clostridium sp.]MEE0269239.1 hemolysin III family protein [Clostridia bacterium]CDE10123.1 channel protein hemolysin III family [Clostridium sp. CAG:354]